MTGITLFFDILLIGLLVVGISQAVKLSRQLKAIQSSRAEMERFVIDFNATVVRAENGIKGLKAAARSGGDDLERLIEKASGLRDELHLLTASADQIASRLSDAAGRAARSQSEKNMHAAEAEKAPKAAPVKPAVAPKPAASFQPSSAAERELMQVLKKIG